MTADVPVQYGDNITIVPHFHKYTYKPITGPYNTQLLLTFLDTSFKEIIPENEKGAVRGGLVNYVTVQHNVSFHCFDVIRQWVGSHPRTIEH